MTNRAAPGRYDLHTHSNVSDGTTSPAEIAAEAKEVGLSGFALTDHDTTDGWEEARQAAAHHGLEFLPGIELTTSYGPKSVHLLVYGPEEHYEPLQAQLDWLRNSRLERASEMIRRLSIDYTLDWDMLLEELQTGKVQSAGRPHLADVLVEAGYFRDRSHAFETALSTTSPYYLPASYFDTLEAIRLVRDGGGFPVLAHPAAFRMKAPISRELMRTFARAGLGGVEIRHPENRGDWITPIHDEANRLGLIMTGASDYHGAGKPNRLGEESTPQETLDIIRSLVATPR